MLKNYSCLKIAATTLDIPSLEELYAQADLRALKRALFFDAAANSRRSGVHLKSKCIASINAVINFLMEYWKFRTLEISTEFKHWKLKFPVLEYEPEISVARAFLRGTAKSRAIMESVRKESFYEFSYRWLKAKRRKSCASLGISY